jgi:UDP-N-acetyl-D-mannosaminuronic acid dehydrogenase
MGLPTALLLAKSGYTVLGYDIDEKKIQLLQRKELPFDEKGLQKLFEQAKHNFHPSTELKAADAYIITVPTPITKQKTCNLSFVTSATKSIKTVLQNENLVVLESTVPPATTINTVKPILDKSNKKYFLSYVSEKAIPGNTLYEMQHNHRIIGGINQKSAELTKKIYSSFVKAPIHLTDTTTAETVKLMENTFRDVNIALANEFALRLQKLHINPWEAIKLANYHPRVNIHQPGPGVGGHCIPIDPWFLSDKRTDLINKSRNINDSMPEKLLTFTQPLLKHQKKPKITIFGVAYKGNIDDTRESPAIPFINKVEKENITVSIFDPYVKQFTQPLHSINEATKDSDCIIVLTDHDIFKKINPKELTDNMRTKQIVDTKNILNKDTWENAGFTYYLLFNSL